MPSAPLLTPGLLGKAAQYSVRVVAAEHLREVSVQFDAFAADPSISVHDLRVALRRLRTWLRAYRPELDDTVRKKTRRRAAKIAHATNRPRDVEATLEWIATQDGFGRRERTGVRWLVDRLAREHADADADMRKLLTRRVPKLIATLAKELESYQVRYSVDDPAPPPTMAQVTRDALAAQADRFARAVDRIESEDDATKLHRVRIAAKRVRYVLETIDDSSGAALVERLTTLQDVLGASHDMHGIVDRIVRELGNLGARDARVAAVRALHPDTESDERPRLAAVRPGLIALATRARTNERKTYESFRNEWSEARVTTAVSRIKTLGDELGSRCGN
jgi:CHAD domain-containing protein